MMKCPVNMHFSKVKRLLAPVGPTAPEVWLLGSSDQSAAVAAYFGAALLLCPFYYGRRRSECDGILSE